MPIKVLSPDDFARRRVMRTVPRAYVDVLSRLGVGEGGELMVADEGASRFTVKQRLASAARAAGKNIAYVRSTPDRVVFEVVEKPARKRTRRTTDKP